MSNDKYTILQISDIHSGKGFDSKNQSLSAEKRYERMLKELKLMLGDDHPKIEQIVFNGDLIDRGKYDSETSSDSALQELLKYFVTPLVSDLDLTYENVCFVPGNHDVDRVKKANSTSEGKAEKAALKDYYFALGASDVSGIDEYGHYPIYDDAKIVDFWPDENNNHRALSWLVNSVPLAGAYEGKNGDELNFYFTSSTADGNENSIDPAYVSEQALTSCKDELKKHKETPLKLAILHHNPIVYPTESARPYRFVNDGDFLIHLQNMGFRLVLHGHQHVARVCYFNSTTPSENGADKTYYESGILCIGAPQFGDYEESAGFNLIEIDHIKDTSAIFQVNVTTIQKNDKKTDKKYSNHLLSINTPFGDSKKLFDDTALAILKSETSREQIKNAVSPTQKSGQHQKHFDSFLSARMRRNQIRAIYSVSVFGADKWSSKTLSDYFLPEGKKNIAWAVARRKSNEFQNYLQEKKGNGYLESISKSEEGLHFEFSDSVYKAIKTSCDNAKELQVLTGFNTWYESANDFKNERSIIEQDFIQRFRNSHTSNQVKVVNSHDSISIWDNIAWIARTPSVNLNEPQHHMGSIIDISQTSISVANSHFRPGSEYKSEDDKKHVSRLGEFPRILIWDMDEFKKTEALQCISFHEEFGLPLFWLDPDSINERRRVGHYTLYSMKSINENTEEECDKPEFKWNTVDGKEPEEEPDYDKNRYLNMPMNYIWKTRPDNLRSTDSYLDDFFYLCELPHIMFAVDAWSMVNRGNDGIKKLKEHTAKKLEGFK